MRILFCASEIFPFAKTGGLADVAGILPKALNTHVEAMAVMPLYGFMERSKFKKEVLALCVILGGISYDIEIFSTEDQGVKTYFISAALLSTTKSLYGDEHGDYANNDLRFGIFCAAVVELALALKVDILHLNDWHCALCSLFIKERSLTLKTIFTIHNLAYQGLFEVNALSHLGIDASYFDMHGLEFHGKVNFLKAGIAYSDRVVTVSPQYAKEILTKHFGCGLDGFLAYHSQKLSGILNGLDDKFFNPKTDAALSFPYGASTLAIKNDNKKVLLQNTKLKDPRRPLLVMISRLVHQKGFDLLLGSLKPLLQKKLNLLILGDGESEYRGALQSIANTHDNFEFIYGYDENFSHQIYASADFLLMPSLFEPCGLSQMIAMRYGTIPIIHDVGGLHDSVHEGSATCGQGVVFKKPTKKSLLEAIDRALKLKAKSGAMQKINTFNMNCDFSFEVSALKYINLYKEILS